MQTTADLEHTVDVSPLTKSQGGLQLFHDVDDQGYGVGVLWSLDFGRESMFPF